MKKNITNSILISVVVNVIGFVINLVGALLYGVLPLSKTIPGGDCIEHIGFGIKILELFPETSYENMALSITETSFHSLSILISLIVVFLISLLLLSLYKIIKK